MLPIFHKLIFIEMWYSEVLLVDVKEIFGGWARKTAELSHLSNTNVLATLLEAVLKNVG